MYTWTAVVQTVLTKLCKKKLINAGFIRNAFRCLWLRPIVATPSVSMSEHEKGGKKREKPWLALILMRNECVVLLLCLFSGRCRHSCLHSRLIQYSCSVWQHWTVRAQHGLPLAPDQADLGADFTSIAAASPLLAYCCTAQLTMACLSTVVSSMQSRGNANLTKGWLTTAAR